MNLNTGDRPSLLQLGRRATGELQGPVDPVTAADRAAVDKALERVGMSAYRKRQIGELSGGQRKRVFLARALEQDGKVILLDEPFTGVDVKTEDQIVGLLLQGLEGRDRGDRVDVALPMRVRLEQLPDHSDFAAIMYGPLVLAATTGAQGVDGFIADDGRMAHIASGPEQPIEQGGTENAGS